MNFLLKVALQQKTKEEAARRARKEQAAKVEWRVRKRKMVNELFALDSLPLSQRTPSKERRIAELTAAIDSSDSSKPPVRRKKKR